MSTHDQTGARRTAFAEKLISLLEKDAEFRRQFVYSPRQALEAAGLAKEIQGLMPSSDVRGYASPVVDPEQVFEAPEEEGEETDIGARYRAFYDRSSTEDVTLVDMIVPLVINVARRHLDPL